MDDLLEPLALRVTRGGSKVEAHREQYGEPLSPQQRNTATLCEV
jgi:hypothetical protein